MAISNFQVVAVQNDFVRVSWTGDGSAIYNVSYSLNGGSTVTLAHTRSDGTSTGPYDYMLYELAGSLVVTVNGVASAAITVGALVAPSAVINLSLSTDLGKTFERFGEKVSYLGLRWEESIPLQAKRFKIEKQTNGGAWQFYSYAQRGVGFVRVYGNAPSATVRYRVTGEADNLASAAVESAAITMPSAIGAAPSAPVMSSLLPATDSVLSARVEWDYLADTIELETSVNAGATWQRAAILPAPMCQIYLTGFSASQSVQVRSKSIGVGGVSAYSSIVTANTFAAGITCSPTNTFHAFVTPQHLVGWNLAESSSAGDIKKTWFDQHIQHAVNDDFNREGIEHAFQFFWKNDLSQPNKTKARIDSRFPAAGWYPPTVFNPADVIHEHGPWTVAAAALVWPALTVGQRADLLVKWDYAYQCFSGLGPQMNSSSWPGVADDDTTQAAWSMLEMMRAAKVFGSTPSLYVEGAQRNGSVDYSAAFGGSGCRSTQASSWANAIERYALAAEGGGFVTQSTAQYNYESKGWFLPQLHLIWQAQTFEQDFNCYALATLKQFEKTAKVIALEIAPTLDGVLSFGDNERASSYSANHWFTFHNNPAQSFVVLSQVASLFSGFNTLDKGRAIDLLQDVITAPATTNGTWKTAVALAFAGGFGWPARVDRTTSANLSIHTKGEGLFYGRQDWSPSATWGAIGTPSSVGVDHAHWSQDHILMAKDQTAYIRQPTAYVTINEVLPNSQLLPWGGIPLAGNEMFPEGVKSGAPNYKGTKKVLASGEIRKAIHLTYEAFGKFNTYDQGFELVDHVQDQVVDQFMLFDDDPIFVHHGRMIGVNPTYSPRTLGSAMIGSDALNVALAPYRNTTNGQTAEVWTDSFPHQYATNIVAPTVASPVVSGAQASWSATDGKTVRMQSVIPAAPQFTIINLFTTKGFDSGYHPQFDWSRSWSVVMGDGQKPLNGNPSTKNLLYAVTASGAAVASSATTELLNATETQKTHGIVVDRVGQSNVVVLFDGRDASAIARPRKIEAPTKFSFTQTTALAKIYVVHTNSVADWSFDIGSGSIAVESNTNGGLYFETAGAGLKTVTLTPSGGGVIPSLNSATVLDQNLAIAIDAAATQTAERAAILAALPSPVVEIRQGLTVLSVVTLTGLDPLATTPLRLRCGSRSARTFLSAGTADNIVLKNGSILILKISITPVLIIESASERLNESDAFPAGVFISMTASKPI